MDHDRGLAIGFLENSIFGRNMSKMVSLDLQGFESGMPRKLSNRAAAKASDEFWT